MGLNRVTKREVRNSAAKAIFAKIINENFLVLMKNVNPLNQESQNTKQGNNNNDNKKSTS